LRHFQRQDLPVQKLLNGTGLTPDTLRVVEELTEKTFYLVLGNAHEIIGDELGFLIGKFSNVLTLGRLGAAMGVAPTLRHGLQTLENYTRLHNSYVRMKLSTNLHGLWLKLVFPDVAGVLQRVHAEAALLLLQNCFEQIHGGYIEGIQYCFGYSKPGNARRYAEEFHGKIKFDAKAHTLLIPKAVLDEPSPYYSAESWRNLQFELIELLKLVRQSEEQAYSKHVGALLGSYEPPLPELGDVAKRLNVSERTLNRRLKNEGASFREIRSELIQVWARRYLAQTDFTVESIAGLLGYQDAANFRRAFKKLQGSTPAQYRAGQVSVTKALSVWVNYDG
jgi:AraC-like DNA-binding protein